MVVIVIATDDPLQRRIGKRSPNDFDIDKLNHKCSIFCLD